MRHTNRRKYHYIYKTTCLVTGKYYLGMHSTDDLNDGYIGSGKRLWYSINKYGKENHVCEILEHYFTREWLREREAELVNPETLTDPLCMNLKLGGDGGFGHINELGLNRSGFTELQKQKGLESMKPFCSENAKKAHSDGVYIHLYFDTDRAKEASKKAHSSEAKKKRRETISNTKPFDAEKNSQYGTCWITNGVTTMKIPKQELNEYISNGWKQGRK